ncbi:MAG: lipid-A-disaccharide synthase [Alphaproteobacteria bacterium]|nr:lipid-A-disaccharide synthase [Alphaproteobacteria bacterium]
MNDKQPFIFLVAGEPSGDELGGRLMAALTAATQGNIRFAGVGGPAMEAQGLESLFPMRELSVMGIMEVLPHIPRILGRVRETAAAINAQQPDIVVTIDSPTFAYRVVQRIDSPRIKRVHYVAPSVWAWRPWRVHKIGRCFDLVLALLPFEPPFFERVGVACTFVGHPVVEYGAADGDGVAFRRRHGVGEEEDLICVLPGSRRSEVSRLGQEFGAALALLAARRPGLKAVVPTVPGVERSVRQLAAEWEVPSVVVMGADEKYGAMAASNAALAASGTVAVELALARLPTVIAYRVSALTAAIFRRLVRVRFVNLINLILNRMIIPERLQENCQASILAEDLEQLLGPAGEKQIEEAAEAIAALSDGGMPPSRRAAQALLDLIAEKPVVS